MSGKPRLGDILIQAGLIDELELEQALEEQAHWGNRLGVALVKLGILDEGELVRALSSSLGVPAARLDGKRIDPGVLSLLPADLARRHGCLPLFTKREAGVDSLYLGMEDPGNLEAVDDVSFRTGMRVRPVIVAPTELLGALEAAYGSGTSGPPAPEPPLPETPIEPGDTAPVLSPTPPMLEPGAPPALVVPEAPVASEGGLPPAPEAEDDDAPVPTRVILQALTQILVEQGAIDRAGLMERVAALRQDRERS